MSGRIGVSGKGQVEEKEQLGLLGTAISDSVFASGDVRGLALPTAASAIAKRGAKTLEETISN
jgi:hypothetical protein